MNALEPSRLGEKIRVKTRISGRRGREGRPGISRRKTVAILILAAVVGILIGLVLGGGFRKMIRVRRDHRQITQSSATSAAGRVGEEDPDSVPGPIASPGR